MGTGRPAPAPSLKIDINLMGLSGASEGRQVDVDLEIAALHSSDRAAQIRARPRPSVTGFPDTGTVPVEMRVRAVSAERNNPQPPLDQPDNPALSGHPPHHQPIGEEPSAKSAE
ncbi:hypothetical protein GCM10023321_82930 [Pseudonocardia eucalypti]|uniref:Uncharacterized protein n=1 Tax=Pseudonocardia eucalypti TaxID=648755 RepID=A0ABP9REM3_9PSEU